MLPTVLLALTGCANHPAYKPHVDCDRHTDVRCATAALADSDRQLAEIYQRVADTQEEEGVKRLALSQRNWFKFRDSYAEFVSLREIDAHAAELQLINQKIDSDLARMTELSRLAPPPR